MEDFYYAGGLPRVRREPGESGALHRDALTVNGNSIWETPAARHVQWTLPPAVPQRLGALYIQHVQQAHLGADLDFLVGRSGSRVACDSH